MNALHFLLSIALLLLIQSCKNSSDNSVNLHSSSDTTIVVPKDTTKLKLSVLMPLKSGNIWTFKTSEFNANGDSIGTSFISQFLIKADTNVGGIVWHPLETNNGYFINTLYRNDSIGLHIANLSGKDLGIYPYPANAGNAILLWNVVSIDTSVHTQLGNLKSYLYQMRVNEVIVHHLFSPNIGPVYLELAITPVRGSAYIAQKLELLSSILN